MAGSGRTVFGLLTAKADAEDGQAVRQLLTRQRTGGSDRLVRVAPHDAIFVVFDLLGNGDLNASVLYGARLDSTVSLRS